MDLLHFKAPPGQTFEVMIQLGAILALLVLYFRKVFGTLFGLHNDPVAQRFAMLILLAFLPSAVIGATLYSFIKSVLFSPVVVAVALIVGGFVILIVERVQKQVLYNEVDVIPLKTGFLIGIAQTVSMIPGVSRSGATIVGGLLLGLERRTAAEFSFFLSIPTMSAAFIYDAYKNREYLSFDDTGLIAVGFIAAFVAALLVVRPFLAVVSRIGFAPFAYYRILLGGLVLGLLYLG